MDSIKPDIADVGDAHPAGYWQASDGNWYAPDPPADGVGGASATEGPSRRKPIVIGLVVLTMLVGVGLAISSSHHAPVVMTTSQLEDGLTGSGWTNSSGDSTDVATSATCVEGPSVAATGVGAYSCQITFDTGGTISRTVTVDATGNWVTSGG